jgi:DNA-binding NtrC family response regulator
MLVSSRQSPPTHFPPISPAATRVFLEPSLSAMIDPLMNGLPDDVLVVEDDAIIALDFEDTILRFGVKSVRTAANVARALQLIDERVPDFALLDISLAREKSFAVAERLETLGIPFAFISGYGTDAGLPTTLAQTPRLPKPCTSDAMLAMLRNATAGRVAR